MKDTKKLQGIIEELCTDDSLSKSEREERVRTVNDIKDKLQVKRNKLLKEYEEIDNVLRIANNNKSLLYYPEIQNYKGRYLKVILKSEYDDSEKVVYMYCSSYEVKHSSYYGEIYVTLKGTSLDIIEDTDSNGVLWCQFLIDPNSYVQFYPNRADKESVEFITEEEFNNKAHEGLTKSLDILRKNTKNN